jgi:beta-glucanase (GH16 family)
MPSLHAAGKGNWPRRSFLKAAIAGGVVAAGVGVGTAVALEGTPRAKDQKPEVPTWSDEFNGPAGSPPDPAVWSSVVNGGGGGNHEREYYVPSANALDGHGNLVITASRDNGTYRAWYGPSQFISGKVWTKGKLAIRYGRLEVRAAFPSAGQPGEWPGIWLLGANYDKVGWPECGEIDIFESFGQDHSATEISGAVHTSGGSRDQLFQLPQDNNATNFHVYTLDWNSASLEIGVDGQNYFGVTKGDLGSAWPFSQPFFLIFNLAIGGTKGGHVPPSAAFPYRAGFDYVRLYGGEVHRAAGQTG